MNPREYYLDDPSKTGKTGKKWPQAFMNKALAQALSQKARTHQPDDSVANNPITKKAKTLSTPAVVGKTGKIWSEPMANQVTPATFASIPTPPPLPTAFPVSQEQSSPKADSTEQESLSDIFNTELPDEGELPSCFFGEKQGQPASPLLQPTRSFTDNPFPFFSSNEDFYSPFEPALTPEENVDGDPEFNPFR